MVRLLRIAFVYTSLASLPMEVRSEILIGAAAPISGPNAWFGEQTIHGVGTAVADINEKGGVLGELLSVVEVDDFCDPDQAVAAARALLERKVVFVVGHPCSGAAISASEVYGEAGVLMISDAATSPVLTARGLTNVFRTVGSNNDQGRIAGDYLADRWADKKIAILHDGQSYGKGLADTVRQRLNERGVTETLYGAISPGQSDYSDAVNRLKAVGADVVYYGGYSSEAALILRQAHAGGYPLSLVAGDGVNSEDFWLVAGPAGENTLFTSYPDFRGINTASSVTAAFRAQGYEPSGSTLHAYAAVQAWAEAVQRSGSVALEPVAEVLRRDQFSTILGPIGFDDKGNVEGISFDWYVWKNGEINPVEM